MRYSQLLLIILPLVSATAFALDETEVPKKWHTPFGLYLSAREAYDMKQADPEHVLFLDVRSRYEVRYVGIADSIDANIPYRVDSTDWRQKSDKLHGTFVRPMNLDFEAAVANALRSKGLDRSSAVIIMCTSGTRAPKAARDLHAAGFKRVYTQAEGFEGIKAKSGPHKGKRVVAGWKHEGLPWSYDLPTSKMYFNFAPGTDGNSEAAPH